MNTILKTAAAALVAGVAFAGAAQADADRDPFMNAPLTGTVVGTAELGAVDTDRDPFGVTNGQGGFIQGSNTAVISNIDPDRNPFMLSGEVISEEQLAQLAK